MTVLLEMTGSSKSFIKIIPEFISIVTTTLHRKLGRELTKCEPQIIANPYDYGTHVELLNFLDKCGDVDRCREVRLHSLLKFLL